MEKNILKQRDLCKKKILTNDYKFIFQPGTFTATLKMMAECRNGLRLFFHFDDGRKVIAVVYWWSDYIGFKEAQPGSRYSLTYTERGNGVYLTAAEPIP